jgi:hypothetical protein
MTETPEQPKIWYLIGALAARVAKQPSLFHLLSTAHTGPHTWFLDKTEWNEVVV